MFLLNDAGLYLEVELGPWGHHLVLLLNNGKDLRHSWYAMWSNTNTSLYRYQQPPNQKNNSESLKETANKTTNTNNNKNNKENHKNKNDNDKNNNTQ